MTTGASPAIMEAFVVRNYLPVAYIFALRMNHALRDVEKLEDKVSDIAVEVVDGIVAKIRNNAFSFRGESRFSTYLWSAMKRSGRDKHYVPKAVSSLGPDAENAFRMIWCEGKSTTECRQLLMASADLDSGKTDEIIGSVTAAVRGTPAAMVKVQGEIAADLSDPAEGMIPTARDPGPEEQFLQSVLKERVETVLEQLDDEDREIITAHYVSGLSIREIGRRMGLKSPQYRFTQARNSFLERAGKLDLEGLYNAAAEKDGIYG